MSESASAYSTAPDRSELRRLAWQPPRLSILGDVGNLTETGSATGMEDLCENNVCTMIVINPINTTNNMC